MSLETNLTVASVWINCVYTSFTMTARVRVLFTPTIIYRYNQNNGLRLSCNTEITIFILQITSEVMLVEHESIGHEYLLFFFDLVCTECHPTVQYALMKSTTFLLSPTQWAFKIFWCQNLTIMALKDTNTRLSSTWTLRILTNSLCKKRLDQNWW